MIKAICFRCGASKSDPLKMCSDCLALPEIKRHQLRSICLSDTCLKQENLVKCSKRLKSKKRLPKFHDKVINRARKTLRRLEKSMVSNSASLDLSTGFFDLSDLEPSSQPDKMALVHVIGRNKDHGDKPPKRTGGTSTIHQIWWQVGKDITIEMYDANKDSMGELYVYYRWLEERWVWACIGKSEFDRLKMVEDAGRLMS